MRESSATVFSVVECAGERRSRRARLANVGRAGIAGNVLLPTKASGLANDSVAVPLGHLSWALDHAIDVLDAIDRRT